MKSFLRVAAFIRNHGQDMERLLDLSAGKEPLLRKFLEGLLYQKFKSDTQAAKYVYPDSSVTATDSAYRMLKSRAWKRLTTMIINLEVLDDNHSKYILAEDHCRRNVLAALKLLRAGESHTAMQLLQETVKESDHYQFTEISAEIYRVLHRHAMFSGSEAKLNTVYQKALYYSQALTAELEAQHLYSELAIHYVSSVAHRPEDTSVATTNVKSVETLLAKYRTEELELRLARLKILKSEICKDHLSAIESCLTILKYLNTSPVNSVSRTIEFVQKLIDSSLHLREHQMGLEQCSRYEEYYHVGQRNWFSFMESYYLLLMQAGRYEDALSVTKRVLEACDDESPIQARHIFELYEKYALVLEHWKQTKTQDLLLINNMRASNEDKQGYNVAFLILRFLNALCSNNTSEVVDSLDSIRKYQTKHLTLKSHPRAFRFFRLLHDLQSEHFSSGAVQSKNRPGADLQFLEYRRNDPDCNLENIEIIPYDILWKTITERTSKLRSN